ncbi:hypothetical protein J4Q44_G00243820 [Coregonus suidteri]|uniref:Rho-GAP domain-containing protein n=1 Tax=Coregonus suidteri TaxID=861788 RepID=A0AAN8QXY2_9TELE
MKNKGAKQRSKKKGSENAFGCDLTEHLQNSGQDVPQVLRTCAEFIEKHGVVDGIYRLSGVTSNIQRLRQEFCSDLCPDLTKDVYLQDIHCVGSLCKLYFRELPNPLLTYELYKKFTDAVSVQEDHERLQHIQGVIKELPLPHFRTLEYLTKHLSHLATLSPQTNMHTRNLALVWAPNLLRSKDIEVASCNGDMAFQEVRVQQSVVEFILNHTEQIFNHAAAPIKTKEGPSLMCGEKYATLPISGQSGPMKLMSLEEAQARSLSPNHPARKERQRENSLPDTSTATLYHTVIDISDTKGKVSGKSKKWKFIFNLGKSVTDSKGRLSRNGSVLMKAQNITEKAAIRPARSMDSLCSLQTDDDKAGHFSSAGGANGFFAPGIKSRTLESDTLHDVSEQDQRREFEMKRSSKATGGSSPNMKRRGSPSVSPPQQKALPEQLKVFKGDDDLSSCQPSSPKNRMLCSGSTHSSASRPSFPGSLFPESSPRHQRKALNISEPFAVSVPLRVSAVISSNSTPCRAQGKERPAAAALKPSRETSQSEQSDSSGSSSYRENPLGESSVGSESSIYSNSSSTPLETEERPAEERSREEAAFKRVPEGSEGELNDVQGKVEVSDLRQSSTLTTREEDQEKQQSPGKQLDNPPAPQHEPKELTHLDMGSLPIKEEMWSDLHLELKITEPEIDIMDEEFMPVFCSTKNTCEDVKAMPDAPAKRRSSLPTHSLLYKGQPLMPARPALTDHDAATVAHSARKHSSDTQFPNEKTLHLMVGTDMTNTPLHAADSTDKTKNKLHTFSKSKLPETDKLTFVKPRPAVRHLAEPSLHSTQQSQVTKSLQPGDFITDMGTFVAEKGKEPSGKSKSQDWVKGVFHDDGKNALSVVMGGIERLSICLEERPHHTLGLPHQDNEDGCGGHSELEDLEEEPWEEVFRATKQWVTSPLHSPTLKDLFGKLDVSSSCSAGEGLNSKELNVPPLSRDDKPTNGSCPVRSIEVFPGNSSQACSSKTETKITHLLHLSSKTTLVGDDATRTQRGNSCTAKQKNTTSSQRFHRQTSYEASHSEKTEQNSFSKHRPYSLNLDLGHRRIRDISNQQNLESAEFTSIQRGAVTPSGTKSNGLSQELELFLSHRQAPVRRNSAPVCVSSVRTAFMVKTCQAKAVPVIPPKVQYSHIPHPRQDKGSGAGKGPEKEFTKTRGEKLDPVALLLPSIRDLKEELENKEPAPKSQIRQAIAEKPTETNKTTPTSDPPVLRRKRSSNAEAFADCPRPERSTVLQRPSFRNRKRPQSLILFSPPFPIMDHPPLGDDAKLILSPIRSPTETSALDIFSKEMADNLGTPEGVTLRNKMTIPKSGQRLETSTSCFYQPQRRSMIFDSRSHRQIE